MQLTLNFPEIDDKKMSPNDHAEDYMKEFEQGDFSHVLLQTRYSAQELLRALLTSPDALETVKISLLKKMGRDIRYLEGKMNEEYRDYTRKHNDDVRNRLRDLFAKENPADLIHRGLEKFRKYNNVYRKLYGGKSFNVISVADSEHEWNESYLVKRKLHIQRCISHLVLSHIRNHNDMLDYYISLFDAQEIVEAVDDMDLSEDKKNYILKYLQKEEK